MRFHFGNITSECSTAEIHAAMDKTNGAIAWQLKDDAVYPWDTKALVPDCLGKGAGPNGKDIIVYKQGENLFVWIAAGLVALIVLILLISILKGGGGSPGTVIYR